MNEELKPISNELEELPKINEQNNEQKINISKENTKVINELPSWNIEPPIEIKRGE